MHNTLQDKCLYPHMKNSWFTFYYQRRTGIWLVIRIIIFLIIPSSFKTTSVLLSTLAKIETHRLARVYIEQSHAGNAAQYRQSSTGKKQKNFLKACSLLLVDRCHSTPPSDKNWANVDGDPIFVDKSQETRWSCTDCQSLSKKRSDIRWIMSNRVWM